MAKTQKAKIVAEYILVDGELVEVDVEKTDIPLRCKLVWAEIITGKKHVVANPVDSLKYNKSQHQ